MVKNRYLFFVGLKISWHWFYIVWLKGALLNGCQCNSYDGL